MIKLLFLGDVVGDKGRECLKHLLPGLIREKGISYVVANGENAAGGSGITQKVATELYDSGVDAITMGDHYGSRRMSSTSCRMTLHFSGPSIIRLALLGMDLDVSRNPGFHHWESLTFRGGRLWLLWKTHST